jgi:hypothetical protein
MAKKVVAAEIEIKTANSIADLKALKKQLKDTAAGSEEFKKLYNQIDDLEDKIKSAKKTSSDWIDTLESAGGPLGAIGGALNKAKVATQSFGGALKATGIGLFVAAIGGLVAAFSQTEGSMKKLQPLMIGMEKIFGGIVKIAEPLIDLILDLGLKALPYVTDAIGSAYSVLSSFLGGLGKLGAAIGKLIKGDFVGAWDEAKKSVTEFGTRYESANNRFIAGTKMVTKTEKEELDKREEARKKAKEKEDERLAKKAEEEKKRLEKAAADAKAYLDFEIQLVKDLQKLDEEKEEARIKEQERNQASIKANADFEVQLAKDLQKLDDEKLLKKKELNAAELVAEKQLQDAKFGIAEAGLNILGSLAAGNEKLANTIFLVDKALAIAKIIVNTQAEIAGYAVANSVFGPAGMAITASQALAAKIRAGIGIATIAATTIAKYKGGGGGTNVPAYGGNGNVAAPLMAQASTTTLNQNQVNQIGNVAARAFVVESDVSGNQERIQRLNRAARIN